MKVVDILSELRENMSPLLEREGGQRGIYLTFLVTNCGWLIDFVRMWENLSELNKDLHRVRNQTIWNLTLIFAERMGFGANLLFLNNLLTARIMYPVMEQKVDHNICMYVMYSL